jgi:putative transposase
LRVTVARYLHWVFEAKKRFGLSVLNYNYMVTSNHIHLLVRDTGGQVIAQSMQLIAGRTAQEYNQRKGRQGAFWEDRYHATAIEGRRASASVCCLHRLEHRSHRSSHPCEWGHSGYREIQQSPKRYAIIDLRELSTLCGFGGVADFRQTHQQWVEEALQGELAMRDARWSEALAVGSLAFVEKVKGELGIKAVHREVERGTETYALREQSEAYGTDLGSESEMLRAENTIFWEENAGIIET